MGSRGAFLGKTNILINQKYRAVLRIGAIRVIEPIDSKLGRSTPTMSRTARAIYATTRSDDGTPKQISVYNKRREKIYDIDLDHDHANGQYPYGHVQYYKNGRRESIYHHPDKRQMRLIEQFTAGLAEAEHGNGKINTKR